jgi:hypothetical protein
VLHVSDITVLGVAMVSQAASILSMAFARTDMAVYASAAMGSVRVCVRVQLFFTGCAQSLSYPATIAFAAHLTGPEEVRAKAQQNKRVTVLQIGVLTTAYFTLTYLTMIISCRSGFESIPACPE